MYFAAKELRRPFVMLAHMEALRRFLKGELESRPTYAFVGRSTASQLFSAVMRYR